MSESRVTFHQVEKLFNKHTKQGVRCSFETERFGYLQVSFDENGIKELKNEPNLHMLRKEDRKYVENSMAIAWRMIYEAPAATGRFE